MIHDWDSHYWIAKTPKGWISAENHPSYDPIFQQASRIRIEPISFASIQAVLEANVPKGYTPFLRTNVDKAMSGEIVRLSYVLALEKGTFNDPGRLALSEVPFVDGFRSELCVTDGHISFDSPGMDDQGHGGIFDYKIDTESGIDIHTFFKR
jgi:hypothetical protein